MQNEPFGLILGDELIKYSGKTPLRTLIDEYEKTQKNIIAIQKVSKSELENYGIVQLGKKQESTNTIEIEDAIEKPPLNKAPTNYAIIGRYVFDDNICNLIKEKWFKYSNLIDLLKDEIKKSNCYAYEMQNNRYDIGSLKGFVEANKDFYLKKHK